MKKDKREKIVVIAVLIFVCIAVVLVCVMCGKKDKEKLPVDGPVEDVQKEEQEELEEPTVVRQEKETIKGEISEFKYGVTQQPVTYNTYDIYSDGTKKLVESIQDMLYDHSGYNATMDQLAAESQMNLTEYLDCYEEVVRLVNEIRKAAGVEPVVLDTTYCQVAGLRAAEIEYSAVFSHERPDGTGCFQVTQYYDVEYAHLAECIARGYQSPAVAVNRFSEDETDYSYMIDARFTKLGVGYSNAGISHEWVLVFAD